MMNNKSLDELLLEILNKQEREGLSGKLIYTILKHYIPIPVIIFSMICITVTIVVALKKGLWRQTSQYLITLALVDLLTMPLLLYLTLDFSKLNEQNANAAHFVGDLLDILLLASNWITTLVAAERYFAISYPLKTYRLRRKNRRILVIVVLLMSFLCKLPSLLMNSTQSNAARPLHPVLLHFNTWVIQVLLYILIPFIILVVVNMKLIRELLRMSKYFNGRISKSVNVPGKNGFFKRLFNWNNFSLLRSSGNFCIDQTFVNSAHRKKTFREERRVIMTLVLLIFTFFIFQAPFVIVSVYENVLRNLNARGANSTDREMHSFSTTTLYLKTLSIPALSLKSVFYFIFYCWFCNKFAKTLKRIFICHHFMAKRKMKNLIYQDNHYRRRPILMPQNKGELNTEIENLPKVCYVNKYKICKHHQIPSSLYIYIDKPDLINCEICFKGRNQSERCSLSTESSENNRSPLMTHYNNLAFSSFLLSNLSRKTPNEISYNGNHKQKLGSLSKAARYHHSNSDNNIDYFSSSPLERRNSAS